MFGLKIMTLCMDGFCHMRPKLSVSMADKNIRICMGSP